MNLERSDWATTIIIGPPLDAHPVLEVSEITLSLDNLRGLSVRDEVGLLRLQDFNFRLCCGLSKRVIGSHSYLVEATLSEGRNSVLGPRCRSEISVIELTIKARV